MNTNQRRPGQRAAWLLLIPLLIACQFVTDRLSPNETTSPAADAPQVAAVPTETTQAPTATIPAFTSAANNLPPTPPVHPSPTGASPRMTAEAAILPAPLTFIGQSGQIMRLESDGRSLQQLTDAPEGVLDFDVSAVDGRLAYVSGNKLIEAGPNGENPIVKVDGGAIVEDGSGAARITQTIDRPRFSPDGSQIAFGLNGVNLIPIGPATDYTVLLASDPFPDVRDPTFTYPDIPPHFYSPESWSPDGRRLLLQLGYFLEGGGLVLLDVASGEKNLVTNPDGIECCDWAWEADGATGYLASDLIAYGMPGLAQVEPSTGGSATLINGAPEVAGVTGLPPNIEVFRAPFAAGDGAIYTFVAIGYQDEPLRPLFHMAQLPPGATETLPMRDDAYYFVDALWAADGRGAVIADAGPSSTYPIVGPLRWLPASGEPALDLPASGGVLRWGLPAPAEASQP